jgi:hypothetical protein
MTGESGPMSWFQLTAAEARTRLEAFLAGREERLSDFLAEVRRRGGPADRLDASLESLDPLWDWMVAAHPRAADGSSFQPRDGGPYPVAWWSVHHPQWADALGPYVAWMAGGFAEYFYACVIAARPGSRWVLGRGRDSADFQHPVLKIAGRGQMPYAVPLICALQWLGSDVSTLRQSPPRRVLELWLGLDAEYEARRAALSRPRSDYDVEALDDDMPFTHVISFDDVVAHRQERRIEALVRALADDPAIQVAVHEDREIVYVEAPGLAVADLRTLVATAWRSGRRTSHADPSRRR